MTKEFKIGLFAVVVMAASFVAINYLRGSDIFGRNNYYEGRFTDLETLVASAPVQINGYSVGQVESVEYDENSKDFKVVCSVDKKFKVPVDSRIVIYSTGLMGGKAVRIELGTNEEIAESHSVLATGSEQDLMAMLSANVAPLIASVTATLDTLSAVMVNVNSLLNEQNKASINASVAHLERTLAEAEKLAKSFGGKSQEINAIVDRLNEVSSKIGPLVDSAQSTVDNIKGVSAQLNAADLQGTVSNIKSAVGNIDETVVSIKQPLDSLLNSADQLINEIKNNPKKYIKVTVF